MVKDQRKLISVCIPTYEMHGVGPIYLKNNLEILLNQTFKNFEVVISDNSKTNGIKKVCDKYSTKLHIRYVKNHDISRGMSTNVNTSIRNAEGKIIKILFLDDFLASNKALSIIAKNFDLKKDKWLVTGYEHTNDGKIRSRRALPTYNDQISQGKNTIGSPSILTIKNDNPLFFDTRLKWFMDCDYYKRCYDRFGPPKIVNEIATVIRLGSHQVSNTEINKSVEVSEFNRLQFKHGRKNRIKLNLPSVTLVAVSGIDPNSAIRPLQYSMMGIGYYDAVLISHTKPERLDSRITFRQCLDDELANKDPKNKNDYSKFMAYDLHHYIDSDFALVVHKNAHVVRPTKWTNDFLKYDYVGAPWPPGIHYTKEGVNVRIGNGGFSLRSRRLLNILNDLKLPFTDGGTGYFNEDGIICVYYRKILEKSGIKFAPPSLAARFSFEKMCSESDMAPFGFHDDKRVVPRLFYFRHTLQKVGLTI